MNPDQELTATIARSNQWLKSNLVALGSAAVLAVYAAGYARTQAAAQRFADEGDERRVARTRPAAVAPALPAESTPAAPQPAVADSAPVKAATHVDAQASSKPKTRQASAAPAATADTAAAARSTDSVATPPAAIVAATPPAPASPTPAAHADSATQPDKDHPRFRDGTFTGWGTSRHGDIQASVEIKDGRIVDAFVSICMTQYSCSWISALPSQVVARQSADVDFVSGATQSTNAFYYAVVEALKKAK